MHPVFRFCSFFAVKILKQEIRIPRFRSEQVKLKANVTMSKSGTVSCLNKF